MAKLVENIESPIYMFLFSLGPLVPPRSDIEESVVLSEQSWRSQCELVLLQSDQDSNEHEEDSSLWSIDQSS